MVWTLEKDGEKLAIAGVDDFYNGYPDLEKVQRLCEGADFVIFAPHTPDILPEIYESKIIEGFFFHKYF